MTTKEGFQAMAKVLEPTMEKWLEENNNVVDKIFEEKVVNKVMNEFDNVSKSTDLLIIGDDYTHVGAMNLLSVNDPRNRLGKNKNKRSLFIFFGMIIISFIIGLVVICLPAHAAFSPEGVNQWSQVFSNARGNPSADYERKRLQQMQQEQHDLQMELLREQIDQLKKQKQRR